ncbi:unnamed protein product [Haemonchus placei]|uniref:Uncharacterized protein n=1 Tax=Haemonchus placei TaxID=6290 RepID=A0A0N4W972_HAEPC|nr:unnamed protein product [Haemonchus placei]
MGNEDCYRHRASYKLHPNRPHKSFFSHKRHRTYRHTPCNRAVCHNCNRKHIRRSDCRGRIL